MPSEIDGIPRYPIEAIKDPAVRMPFWDVSRDDWYSAASRLDAGEVGTLALLLECLCPHDWLSQETYRTAALRIDARIAKFPGERDEVSAFLAMLAQQAGGRFEASSTDAKIEIVTRLEGRPEFHTVHRLAIKMIYDDPVVWSGCGYEGVAGCSADAIRKDNNDLDWLPSAQSLIDGRS